MVNVKKELLSPCGLYCGVCSVYLAHINDDLELKERIFPFFKQWGANSIEDVACTGCLSEGIVFPFCCTCAVKDCINEKKIEGCHQCEDFPCEIINDWPSPEGKEVMIKEIQNWREKGTEKWVKDIEDSLKCPECGIQLFRGLTTCYKCNFNIS